MIFRQMFDSVSFTYTYLLASRRSGEALIIDPVVEKVGHYLQLMEELDVKLLKAIDTHVHADHITGLGELRDATRCVTVMGRESKVDMVSMRVNDGDSIEIENIELKAMYTPGHTDDSYCFALPDRIFTGDTLLIRGTGRTDFQNGSSIDAYESLFNKVLKLPDDTLVFPGHDYKGDTVSTIGEEKAFNPRLQVSSADDYAKIMDSLNLPDPQKMDISVPANLVIGYSAEDADPDHSVTPERAIERVGYSETMFIDLREESERVRDGIIPGSVHMPYQNLRDNIKPGGLLAAIASNPDQELLLYCAYGERSQLALKEMQEAGLVNACGLSGGIDGWIKAGGPLDYPAERDKQG
ncbi:MAG: MBL fold metallo-hydrolase [Rhodospirillales bacterium]|nr:MBL fold metallo-hydrolase [Rhodospirillales bacterium]